MGTQRLCEMVVPDGTVTFGYSACRLPAVGYFFVPDYGNCFLCPHHKEEMV